MDVWVVQIPCKSWLICSFAKWHFQRVGGHWACLAGYFNFAILKFNNFPNWRLPSATEILGFRSVNDSIQPGSSNGFHWCPDWWVFVRSRSVWNLESPMSIESFPSRCDSIWFDIPVLFQVGMKHKWVKRCIFRQKLGFCLNKRSRVSCSFMNQESGQLAVSRLGAMPSAGLNPTDSEVGVSFWVYPRWRKWSPGNLVIAGECRGKFGKDESSWVIGGKNFRILQCMC